MKKFKHEEKFFDNLLSKTGEMFSILELSEGHGLSPNILKTKPKFIEHFSDEMQYSDGTVYSDSIFIFDENIYIYLSKTEQLISSFSCKIYYPIKKKKDVEFFVLNLKKIKKNGN
jgi:hypothetical protein